MSSWTGFNMLKFPVDITLDTSNFDGIFKM